MSKKLEQLENNAQVLCTQISLWGAQHASQEAFKVLEMPEFELCGELVRYSLFAADSKLQQHS